MFVLRLRELEIINDGCYPLNGWYEDFSEAKPKNEEIIWNTSDVYQLKLKENDNKINIWLNYKGYNIIMPMGMWGFDEEVSERGISYNIGGESMLAWYYIVEKNDLRLFVDLVYFFIKEHNCDKMINDRLLIGDWN